MRTHSTMTMVEAWCESIARRSSDLSRSISTCVAATDPVRQYECAQSAEEFANIWPFASSGWLSGPSLARKLIPQHLTDFAHQAADTDIRVLQLPGIAVGQFGIVEGEHREGDGVALAATDEADVVAQAA